MSDIAFLTSALPRIMDRLRSRGERSGLGRRVSLHQARILALIEPDDPLMVTELAEYLGVTASTMSLNLKRMVEAGLVARERDPDDRRVMNVRLTELGVAVRQEVSELDPARVDRALRGLLPESRRRAMEGVALLARAVEQMDGAEGARGREREAM